MIMCWIPKMQPFSSFMFLLLVVTLTHIIFNSNFFLPPTTTHSKINTSLDLDFIEEDDYINTLPQLHRTLWLNGSLRQSISNQTQVSIILATHLLSNKHDSNIVFSPLSIHGALSLLTTGSKGPMLDQLLVFLKTNTTDELNYLYSQLVSLILADGSPNGGPRLSFANRLWFDQTLSLKPSFKQVVDSVYNASCKHVDFQTKALEVVSQVNLWAEEQTNGLIKELLHADAVDKSTMLIFANAVYFKGAWSQEFERSNTKESDFHLLDGNKVQVPFMTSRKTQFVCEYDDFKVLGLPYMQGQDTRQFTMYFILPNAKDGLQSLIEKIGSTSDFFERHIPHQKVDVGQFLIPKFKISFGFEASGMLKELKLVLPLKKEDGMSKMIDSVGQSLYVSSIHHKSFVDVNEEGTEAAAGTYFSIQSVGMAKDNVDFVADHPFLFVIREEWTGILLFMGKVIDPSVD